MTKKWQSPSLEFDFICYLFSEYVSADGFSHDFEKKKDLNWLQVLELVHHHRFWAVVKRYLESYSEGVPDVIYDNIQAKYKQKCIKNLAIIGCLNLFKQLFEAHNIPFIVIKGPLLSQNLYGDINTRFSGDLDILVDSNNIRRAHELLMKKGFTPLHQDGFDDYPTLYTRRQKDLVYIYQNQLKVEIHTRLEMNPKLFPLKTSDWEKYTRMQVYCGNEYRVFKDEIQLIYLSFHGTRHLWQRLFWLLDVVQLSKRFSAKEKTELISLAKRFKAQYALKSAFKFASCFASGALLKGEFKALEPFSSLYNDFWTVDHITLYEPKSAWGRFSKRCISRKYEAYFFRGFRVRMYDLAFILFLPGTREFEFAKLPYHFRWGYFALRPVLLAKRILFRGKSL